MRAITVAALLIGVVDASNAQVNCQKIGEQTYCSNGQVMQRFGNTVYDGKGHAWQEIRQPDYERGRDDLSAVA